MPRRILQNEVISMGLMLLGGLLIALPAVVVVVYFWGTLMMFPALASIFIAALPFLAFMLVARRLRSMGSDEFDS